MGTHCRTRQNETKKSPSCLPNLKGIKARHLGRSHWRKGKQILLAPQIKLAWKVHVQVDTGQSTIHTKYSLKKKPPLQPPTTPQIWGRTHLSY